MPYFNGSTYFNFSLTDFNEKDFELVKFPRKQYFCTNRFRMAVQFITSLGRYFETTNLCLQLKPLNFIKVSSSQYIKAFFRYNYLLKTPFRQTENLQYKTVHYMNLIGSFGLLDHYLKFQTVISGHPAQFIQNRYTHYFRSALGSRSLQIT